MSNTAGHSHPNRLANADSPYLLQHADNPVDWYEWGQDAFEAAREQDKPIFLSIGYSACHWCHVMAHESFEDPAIAELMNALFVNIKVDREQHPQVDELYMTAVQMLTGSGGWPLSVWLTPDLKPFYGGTYFPPEDRWGHPGFRKVLMAVAQAYRDKREDIVSSAGSISETVQQHMNPSARPAEQLDHTVADQAAATLAQAFDAQYGGFGQAPKFPPTSQLQLLLRHYRRTSQVDSLHMVTSTLNAMARRGMYDQIGGGFHRYSVDQYWLVPHYEKMLYDNALLAITYIEAWQATGAALYRRIATETLDYVLREMTDESGGFYASQDADSEGQEGMFYTWTPQEVREVLADNDDAELFCKRFGITEEGNFEGRTVAHMATAINALAEEAGISPDQMEQRIDHLRTAARKARDQRTPPDTDHKILTDWTGLMIAAMARGYAAFADDRYKVAAERAAAFILDGADDQCRVPHVCYKGHRTTTAGLDDYAFLAWGLIELYQATFEASLLLRCQAVLDCMIAELHDDGMGGFFHAPPREDLIARSKQAFDASIPSGNAVSANVLLQLGLLTGLEKYRTTAERLLTTFAYAARQQPTMHATLLNALDYTASHHAEIALVGRHDADNSKELMEVIRSSFLPHAVLTGADPTSDNAPQLAQQIPVLAGKVTSHDRPQAIVYVCRNFTCREPATTATTLRDQLADMVPAAQTGSLVTNEEDA